MANTNKWCKNGCGKGIRYIGPVKAEKPYSCFKCKGDFTVEEINEFN